MVTKSNVVSLWDVLLNRHSHGVTLELDNVVYSPKHGHEICIMHMVGKNVFPKMTTAEILEDSNARVGVSPEDLIAITRLDEKIKAEKQALRIVEYDMNGIVTLMNAKGVRKRCSEKKVAYDKKLLVRLPPQDVFKVGYHCGFQEGRGASKKVEAARFRILKINRLLVSIKKYVKRIFCL